MYDKVFGSLLLLLNFRFRKETYMIQFVMITVSKLVWKILKNTRKASVLKSVFNQVVDLSQQFYLKENSETNLFLFCRTLVNGCFWTENLRLAPRSKPYLSFVFPIQTFSGNVELICESVKEFLVSPQYLVTLCNSHTVLVLRWSYSLFYDHI